MIHLSTDTDRFVLGKGPFDLIVNFEGLACNFVCPSSVISQALNAVSDIEVSVPGES